MNTVAKKKILYMITKSNWGGAQRYVYDLATHLPDGLQPVVAFGGTGSPDAPSGRLAEMLKERGVRTVLIPELERNISLGADMMAFWALCRILKIEKPDVLHLNSSKVGGLGALAGRLARVQHIVFTAHGWPFWEKRSTIVRAAVWFFSWLTALLSHHVICISDFDLRIARRMPGIASKAVRIYNGISPIDFLPRQESDRMRVLTNAELNYNKNLFAGIDVVIAARARGADIAYHIMGNGELRPALENYIAEKDAGSFVSLLGFVSEGSRHYRNYDIFFLPSKKEGVPYVLLEAGIAGLPVVASNVGGIQEIIDDGTTGILKSPTDIKGFTQALTMLANDPALCTRLGTALKRKVLNTFSFEPMMANTSALYRS